MNTLSQSASGILMVTKRLAVQDVPWAETAGSAAEAIDKWKQVRHPCVFADFGDLGDGMTGARLAAALRKESAEVVIVLLSDEVQPHHRIWAQRNGATDVIERTSKAMSAYLPAGAKVPQAAAPVASAAANIGEKAESIAALVSERLQQYGRLGPARTLVVRDALEALVAEKGHAPTVNELAHRVAKEIMWPEHRTAFLNSFTTKGR